MATDGPDIMKSYWNTVSCVLLAWTMQGCSLSGGTDSEAERAREAARDEERRREWAADMAEEANRGA